jgi:predicted dinucleotide-binding enzyme
MAVMKDSGKAGFSRRAFSKRMIVSAMMAVVIGLLPLTASAVETEKPLKIGIIGAGLIGGSVGVLWAKAGHEVFFSSRHPEELGDLLKEAGPSAKVGTPAEAALFGDVVFVAVPYHAMPKVGKDLLPLLKDKIVIDCGNPYPSRDGEMAVEALKKGTGIASAEFFPGVRLVRAYNSISYKSITTQAHREGQLMAIPMAGDDQKAVDVTMALIKDSGFDPVFVGPLSRAREFDNRSAMYGRQGTAQELKDGFGL